MKRTIDHNPSQRSAATARRQRSQVGAAMSEFVIAVPFLTLILLIVLYFGRANVRVQHAHVMDRYEAWREVGGAYGGGTDPYALVNDPNRLMNQTFFAGNASSIDLHRGDVFPTDAADRMVREAAQLSEQASELAQRMFDDFPWGRSIGFNTTHVSDTRLLASFDGPVRHAHTRFGNDWRFVNGLTADGEGTWQPSGSRVSILPVVRDQFYSDFDEALEQVEQRDNELARTIRALYLSEPRYIGPTVNPVGELSDP